MYIFPPGAGKEGGGFLTKYKIWKKLNPNHWQLFVRNECIYDRRHSISPVPNLHFL